MAGNEHANPTPEPDGIMNSRFMLGALLGIFCLGLFLVIANPSKFQMDEHFYTDAAIRMVQTGDYWTPYFADGHIRLLKPILTYWASAFSFQIFGINPIASRLPFLLASALAICVTYQLSRTIFKCRRSAFLAALIIASNLQMMILSTRSTPDALVCLFVVTSMWGFARVWFEGDKTLLGPLLAFAGIGLAVEAKGMLGAAPLGAAAIFWVIAKPEWERTKKLLRWLPILVGLCFALFWYAIMIRLHGISSLRDFFDDQAGKKVTQNPVFILRNVRDYLWVIFRYFSPWTLFLVGAIYWKRRALAGFWKKNKAACAFLSGLTVILIVFFCFGNIRKSRYLNTSFPMLAVLVAWLLTNLMSHEVFQKWFKRGIVTFAIIFALMGAGLLATGFVCSGQLIGGGVMFLGLGIAGIISARSADQTWRCVWLAGALFSSFVSFSAFLQPALSPSPLPLVADALLKLNRPATTVHTLQITDSDAGQIRLLAGGKLTINKLDDPDANYPDLSTADIVVTHPQHLELFKDAGYQLHEIKTISPVLVAFPQLARLANAQATNSCWIALKAAR